MSSPTSCSSKGTTPWLRRASKAAGAPVILVAVVIVGVGVETLDEVLVDCGGLGGFSQSLGLGLGLLALEGRLFGGFLELGLDVGELGDLVRDGHVGRLLS